MHNTASSSTCSFEEFGCHLYEEVTHPKLTIRRTCLILLSVTSQNHYYGEDLNNSALSHIVIISAGRSVNANKTSIVSENLHL